MSKSIPRNLIEAVESALRLIFEGGKYADQVIESTLKKNRKWGSRDRRFIAENVYDIVRWWRWVITCGEIEEKDAQRFLKAIRTWFILQNKEEIPPFVEGIPAGKVIENSNAFKSVRAIRESIPDWLDELGFKELDSPWNIELQALNEQASAVLRVNTLKVTREALKKSLKGAGIGTEELSPYPDALLLTERANVFQFPMFKEGWFEMQDASSQLVGPFLDVLPGMRVVDACAGAGGKTLHLAALMQGKGHILALDTEGWKLQELRHRARRDGAGTIETRTIDSTKVIKRLHLSADRVLLDVPCSGLGVLRRNPDAKWKLSLEHIQRMKLLQQEILQNYSKMVKPGGKLVYATCSILPSENQVQIEEFLSTHPEFSLEEEKQVLPSAGFDGFYMARMVLVRGEA